MSHKNPSFGKCLNCYENQSNCKVKRYEWKTTLEKLFSTFNNNNFFLLCLRIFSWSNISLFHFLYIHKKKKKKTHKRQEKSMKYNIKQSLWIHIVMVDIINGTMHSRNAIQYDEKNIRKENCNFVVEKHLKRENNKKKTRNFLIKILISMVGWKFL